MAKSSKTSRIPAFFVITVNCITVILSLLMFAVGLWIIVSPKTLVYVIQVIANPALKAFFPEESLTLQLGIGVVLLSVFCLFISLMGLYGAVYTSPFLLFMYAALVLLLMLLECALVFYFTSNISKKGISEQDGELAHALRLALQCCDYNNTVTEVARQLPWSCCGSFIKNCSQDRVVSRNCMDSMNTWLNHYGTLVYGCIVASHVLLASCSLLRRASSASRSHT